MSNLAPLTEIRPPTREQHRQLPRRHAHRGTLPTESPHPIPLPVFVYRAINLHVDTEPARHRDDSGGIAEGDLKRTVCPVVLRWGCLLLPLILAFS